MPFKVHSPGAVENYFNTASFVIWKAFTDEAAMIFKDIL
jgi:hypothetical protein